MTTLKLWLKREAAFWRYMSAVNYASPMAPLHKLEFELAAEEYRRWMAR